MQIHELNNFSGTLGAGAYLAIDNGTDTGRISSQGLLASTEARIDAANDQITDLKSEINANVIATGWELGSLVSGGGGETSSNQRVRSGHVKVTEGTRVTLSGNANCLIVYCYDERKWYMSDSTWTDGNVFVVPPNVSYIRVLIRASSSNPSMTSDDVATQASRCTISLCLNQNVYFNSYTDDELEVPLSEIDKLFNRNEDSVSSWQIGFVYSTGGWGSASDFPQYVSTKDLQSIDDDVLIYPSDGYQVMIRLYENGSTTPTTNIGWIHSPMLVPKNTPFKISLSKITPETVTDIDTYIDATNIYDRVVYQSIPQLERDGSLKIAVLGDSISTYNGVTEDAQTDGTTNPFYPTGDVTALNKVWWHIVASTLLKTNNPTVAVSAVSRSSYVDQSDATIPCGYDDTRIARLGANGAPDIILVELGTNDAFGAQTAPIPSTAVISELEQLSNTTNKGIALTVRKLQNAYPKSKIVLLIPKQVNLAQLSASGYNLDRVSKIADEIDEIGNRYGVWKVIDLRKCGINQSNVASLCTDSQIHPNAMGMEMIAQYVINQLT